jgi:hypothetical protein
VVGIHGKVCKFPLHTRQLHHAVILLVAFINKNCIFYFKIFRFLFHHQIVGIYLVVQSG